MENIQYPSYKIYTDGACSGNPGRGAWAAIVVGPDNSMKEMVRAYTRTTNNRMELRAVIESLRTIPENSKIVVVTDSQYVSHAVNKKWLDAWVHKNWRTSQKKPVANRDLWESLLTLTKKHTVKFKWVEGHAGHPENERCDELAVEAYTKGPWTADEGYDSTMSTTIGQKNLL